MSSDSDIIKNARYVLFMLRNGGRRKDGAAFGGIHSKELRHAISVVAEDGLVDDDGEIVSLTERGRSIDPGSYEPSDRSTKSEKDTPGFRDAARAPRPDPKMPTRQQLAKLRAKKSTAKKPSKKPSKKPAAKRASKKAPASKAARMFDEITNASGETTGRWTLRIESAWNEGNNANEGFAPHLRDVERSGKAGKLKLYVVADRLVAVGNANGKWAIDVTDAIEAHV